MTDSFNIRQAIAEEASALSELALKSKSFWGYPDEWLQLWKEDLKIKPEQIQKNPTFVASLKENLVGFCSVELRNETLEVMHLWIHPDHMNNGWGTRLLAHTLKSFQSYGLKTVRVIADPYAVPFYEKFGFETQAWEKSQPEGRKLPVMFVSADQLKLP